MLDLVLYKVMYVAYKEGSLVSNTSQQKPFIASECERELLLVQFTQSVLSISLYQIFCLLQQVLS